MALENRARHGGLVLLLQRQGREQMMSGSGEEALGISLQEHQRPLGFAIEQRRSGGKAQDVGGARPRPQRLFGKRQKP